MTECKSTLLGSVKYPVWSRHQVWLLFHPRECIKKSFQNKRRTCNGPFACQIAVFLLPSQLCPFRLRNAASHALLYSPENAHRSPVVSPTLRSAKMLGKRKKDRREFPFLPPPPLALSFVYLFGLSLRPSKISSPPVGARTGLDDARRIPHLLKGSRYGITVEKVLSRCVKGLIYERDCGLCAAACGIYITQVCTHSMQNDR